MSRIDRDRIIRIILEGRDRLSGALRSAVQNVDAAASKMERSFRRVNRESDALDKTTKDTFDAIDKRSRVLDNARKRAEALSNSARTLRRDLRLLTDESLQAAGRGIVRRGEEGRFERVEAVPVRRQVSGAFREFREGRDIARETEERIKQRLPETREEAKAARDRVNEENRLREEARRREEVQNRESLRQQISRREASVNDEVDKLKALEKSRKEDSADRISEEIKALRKLESDRKSEARKTLDAEIADRKAAFFEDQERRREAAAEEIADLKVKRDETDTRAAKRKVTQEIDAVRNALRVRDREERAIRDRDIRALQQANRELNTDKKNALSEEISNRESALKKENDIQQANIERQIRTRLNGLREESRQRRIDFEDETRERRNQVRKESAEAITKLQAPDEPAEIRKILGDREDFSNLNRDATRLERTARKTGIAFGDFFRGLRRGRSDVRDLSSEVRAADTPFARFGQRIGQISRSLGTLVNLRWFLLISALQLFGSVIAIVGSNLVSLASSAALAAVAVGAGLAAAFAQAAGPAALFAAVVNRVGRVMDASTKADQVRLSNQTDQKAADDARTQTIQRLADAHYALKRAIEAVGESELSLIRTKEDVAEAERRQLQAVESLAEARKQAARDIVDANFEERDAALALKEAELSVLDAKERLRNLERQARGDTNVAEAQAAVREAQQRLQIAQTEGDQAEISKAQHQLTLAKQSLDDINAAAEDSRTQLEQAQTSVKRAELTREEAVVRNKRAREDAAKTRREGIEENDRVVSARRELIEATRAITDAQHNVVVQQRALRDSIHSVVVARREEKDAQNALAEASTKQTAAQKALQDQLKDLSPAERGLFRAFRNIQATYRRLFRPITDIVVRSLTFAVNRAAKVLEDPRILGAFKTLATAVGEGIRELATFFTGDTFIDAFSRFIRSSARNLPVIVKLIENLSTALINVAKAGEPIFNSLIGRFAAFSKKIKEATEAVGISEQDQMDAATRQQGPTNRLQDFLGQAAQHLNSWIKLGVAISRVIGFLIPSAAPSGQGVLQDATKFFDHIADWLRDNPEKVQEFFDNMRIQFSALAQLAGKVATTLFKAFTSENAEAFTKVIVETILPGLTLMLQTVGFLSRGLVILFNIPGVKLLTQILVAEKALNRVFPVTQKLTNAFKILIVKGFTAFKTALAESFPVIARFVGVMRTAVIPAIVSMTRAFIASTVAFFTSPLGIVVLAILAIAAAVILLDRKFHFLRPTIHAIFRAFKFVFDWIKDHWKLLLVILTGPLGLVILAVIKWKDKIIGFFGSVISWLRGHWKTIIAVILAPFALGGAIILGFIKFKDKIIGFFGTIKDGIISAFKKAFNWVREEVKKLGGFIREKLSSIPVIGKFFKKGPPIESKILEADEQDKEIIHLLRGQGKSDKEILDTLVKRGRISKKRLQALIGEAAGFAGGGEAGSNAPSSTDTVPAMLTPGEWVLNRTQIRKVASAIGQTVSQTKAWLFGTNQGKGMPGPNSTKTRPHSTEAPFYGKSFTLVPHVDQDNNTVWFIQFDDGTFGQVTSRDATKIKSSRGNYIPNYVKRNIHGFSQYRIGGIEARRFAMGGVVPAVQRFAQGGVVTNSPANIKKEVNVPQHFEVHTQGESDWNYIMRLAAQRAQEAF